MSLRSSKIQSLTFFRRSSGLKGDKSFKQEKLEIPMHIFIQTLGIEGIDRDLAVDLFDKYKNIEALKRAKIIELIAMNGMSGQWQPIMTQR